MDRRDIWISNNEGMIPTEWADEQMNLMCLDTAHEEKHGLEFAIPYRQAKMEN